MQKLFTLKNAYAYIEADGATAAAVAADNFIKALQEQRAVVSVPDWASNRQPQDDTIEYSVQDIVPADDDDNSTPVLIRILRSPEMYREGTSVERSGRLV